MLQKGYFPVHMHFYGFWYRRKKKQSLLKQVNDPQNPENKLRLEALQAEAQKITQSVIAIELPNATRQQLVSSIDATKWKELAKTGKENILIITPALRTDPHVLNLVKQEYQNGKHITLLTTKPCPYIGRQWYENMAEVFDMTTFLAEKNQLPFIDYIVKTRNIKKIYLCNEETIKSKLDFSIPVEIITYQEDESLYAVYEKKYQKSKKIVGRVKRKIKNLFTNRR